MIAMKRDDAERDIVRTLEAAGATVSRLSPTGASGETGLPDLLVGFRGVNYLLEVKTGRRKLRPGQVAWRERWQGQAVAVVRSVEDALAAVGA